jgi:hypothetical protein
MNQPAFPVSAELCQDLTIEQQRGMTLRDYFAAKAMQGLMHNYHPTEFLENKNYLEDIAMASYFMADAMMKAREA